MEAIQVTTEMRAALSIKTLHFSHNWNNKLDCDSFSTVRLRNDKKYELLDLFEVTLKRSVNQQHVSLGIVRLQYINHFLLHKVNAAISFIDANLTVIDFQLLVKTMYKNKKIDFGKHEMSFLVFQYCKPEEIYSMMENVK